MKLATFEHAGVVEYGVVEGDEIRVVSRDTQCPRSLRAVLVAGAEGMQAVRRAGERAPRVALKSVRLLAPIPDPRKFLAVGGTYPAHAKEAEESGKLPPGLVGKRVWFNKQVSCIAGPYDDVYRPRISDLFDCEGEFALIIGRRCRNVPRDQAHLVIAGYCVANDLTVRDWVRSSPTITLGKSFDTHGPLGPWMVTADEIPDPNALGLRTMVNSEVRQNGNTSEMGVGIGVLIEELSAAVTLEPGDVLSTGTPAGSGPLMKPPRYLKAGDVVRVEIERCGYIENKVIDEPAPLGPMMPSAAQLAPY